MDKIFEEETQRYLKQFGVSEKEIYKIQFEKCKEAALEILETVVELIKEDKFEEVSAMLEHSPAGDDMGCDNSYIDFSSIFEDDRDGWDISDIVGYLRQRKEAEKK